MKAAALWTLVSLTFSAIAQPGLPAEDTMREALRLNSEIHEEKYTELIIEAHNQGNPIATFLYYGTLIDHTSKHYDTYAAREVLEEGCRRGSWNCQLEMANHLTRGDIVPRNALLANEILSKIAEEGCYEAQLWLARHHLTFFDPEADQWMERQFRQANKGTHEKVPFRRRTRNMRDHRLSYYEREKNFTESKRHHHATQAYKWFTIATTHYGSKSISRHQQYLNTETERPTGEHRASTTVSMAELLGCLHPQEVSMAVSEAAKFQRKPFSSWPKDTSKPEVALLPSVDYSIDHQLPENQLMWHVGRAVHGGAESNYIVGYHHWFGFHGRKNKDGAVKHLQIAADQGHKKAMTLLHLIKESEQSEHPQP